MIPDDRTVASIEQQRVIKDTITNIVYSCGCDRPNGRWRLCQYHDGFEDGLEAAERSAE